MKTKLPEQVAPKKAEKHQLDASAFDAQAGATSMPSQPLQLKASLDTLAHLQPQKTPSKFPWKGTVTGVAKLPLYSAADPKKGAKLAEIKKGTEVSVIGQSGAFLKIKGTTLTKGIKEGYAQAAHVSRTISELNQTAAALDGTMNKMWKDSFNADKTKVQEKSASIVKEKGKIKAKNLMTGSQTSVPVDQSLVIGETFVGDVHTHPYTKAQGNPEGAAFSAGDITRMRGMNCFNGYQQIVEAGNKRFALVITDEQKAMKFFKANSSADITKTYNTALNASRGTFQQKIIAAVWAVIGKNGTNGIQFYGTVDKQKKKFDAM